MNTRTDRNRDIRPNERAAGRTRLALRRRGGAAFSLIELLVVILIIGVLAALAVSIGMQWFSTAGENDTRANMAVIKDAISQYQEDTGDYPGADDDDYDMEDLVDDLSAHEPSAEQLRSLPAEAWGRNQNAFVDAWGEEMRYDADAGRGGVPLLISSGPDKEFGTDDDIRSDKN
jgi:type II secretion system protein G